MKEKFSLVIALLLAMTSAVSAAVIEDNLHTLAICFLVLCVIVLLIAIIFPIILYRRRMQQQTKGYTGSGRGSMYNLSARERKISEVRDKEPNYYGIYHDAQPANSIYLPLEKRDQQNENYAHLEGSKPNEDPHTYEELKKKSTFGATYDNPVATTEGDDDDDDHDYEVADATIVRPKSKDYDNPPPPDSDTAF